MASNAPFALPHSPGGQFLRGDRAGPAPHVKLRVRCWDEFDCSEQVTRWDALAQWAAEPNPFYESWYLLPSLRALDPQGKVKLLCLEVDGQLAGLMPIRHQPFYYGYPLPHFRNWVHDNCFCGQPLVAGGLETHFWREILAWCDGNAGTSLFLHMMQMPGQGVQHLALKALLELQQRPAANVLVEERAMLSSTLSPEAYLAQSLTTKKRKELRRQHRRLEEAGNLEFRRDHSSAKIVQWANDFLELEQRGWKGRAGSALSNDAGNSALFRSALEGAAERSRLERLTLLLDGKPIAMLATFLTPPGAYSFKTAFDENYARFSPGVLLQQENLALLECKPIGWVDSCAIQDHKMIDHFWRERRQILRHSIAIGGTARRSLFSLLARLETGKPAGGIA